MVSKEVIERINQLAHKEKATGLTSEEKEEQKVLRRQYIDGFKANLRAQLNQIEFVEDVEKDQGKEPSDYAIEIEEELK